MKKYLAIFALLASVLTARAELSVEWIDDNTIRVSGYGYTVVTNVVYTNSLGTCTNCVQISPEQMLLYKTEILTACDSGLDILNAIKGDAYSIWTNCSSQIDEIGTFQKFDDAPVEWSSTFNVPFTNYVYTVDNSQTMLDRQVRVVLNNNASFNRWASYNNGIYDYATQYVTPILDECGRSASTIIQNSLDAEVELRTVKSLVSSMSETACECQGDGAGSCPNPDGGGDSGYCPCVEQLDAIKDYVEHIDDDFHVQLQNMSDVTNFIPRMDAYAKIISGVLYNDGTIVVDDGENSWSNVYRRGESDLYDYDKSNILQRIELLVFGLTSLSSSTNWGNVGDVESDVLDVQEKIEDVGEVIAQNHQDISTNINTIKGKIQSLFNTLNFFGAGSLSEFALNDPYTIQHFGNYSFEVTSNDVESLGALRSIFRTCFQVFYWVSGICFMIFFWYWIISFTIKHVLGLLRFFNNLLT
jgi:hypothetical protein